MGMMHTWERMDGGTRLRELSLLTNDYTHLVGLMAQHLNCMSVIHLTSSAAGAPTAKKAAEIYPPRSWSFCWSLKPKKAAAADSCIARMLSSQCEYETARQALPSAYYELRIRE